LIAIHQLPVGARQEFNELAIDLVVIEEIDDDSR